MRSGFFSLRLLLSATLLLTAFGCMHRPDKTAKPVTITFFGDSVTYGYGVDRTSESFYSLLVKDLATGKYGPATAINAGKSGDDTADAFRRIGAVNLGRPDIVVIALGLNDCQTKDITPAVYRENIKRLISALTPGTRVVIATSNTFLETGEPIWTRLNAAFAPYMAEAEKIARENRYPLIDVHAEWVKALAANPDDARSLYADPTHPSATGHRLIHDVYLKSLEKILKDR